MKACMNDHHTIGSYFNGLYGAVYLCTGWIRNAGYNMKVIVVSIDGFSTRKIGDVVNVSERAIGRSYHKNYHMKSPENFTHESKCDCSDCFLEKDI